jgi:hypothetical protein
VDGQGQGILRRLNLAIEFPAKASLRRGFGIFGIALASTAANAQGQV